MLNVALTGNVASGKSTVLEHFANWGASVIDADRIVHEAQAPGSPTLAHIVEHFGGEVLRADGSLDRDRLRRIIVTDDNARAALNAIVHPEVRRRRAELVAEARAAGTEILVNDIPLLFEVLDLNAFDAVVLVDAPSAERRRRLVEKRGLPFREADRLMATQIPADDKRGRSDVIIENDGSLQDLETRARAAWDSLQRMAKARG